MAAGVTIKHKRKAGAFVDGELAAGEWGLDVSGGVWYYSVNGTTVTELSTSGGSLGGLSDMALASPAEGEILSYDDTADAWVNRTAAEAGLVAAGEKGAAGGVATLDGSGKVPAAQMPAVSVGETFSVGSQAAMLALTAQLGDVAIRTDQSNSRYLLVGTDPTVLGNWAILEHPADAVSTVFGRSGAVVAAASDYDASQIDNDSGVTGAKVSDALNTLNAGKANASHAHAATDITSGDLATARMQANAVAAVQAGAGGTISNASLVIEGGTL